MMAINRERPEKKRENESSRKRWRRQRVRGHRENKYLRVIYRVDFSKRETRTLDLISDLLI